MDLKMNGVTSELGEAMIARVAGDPMVFDITFDTIEPTGVNLDFIRGDKRVASIHNVDGTDRLMAQLATGEDSGDVLAVSIPERFVGNLLDEASEAGRVTDETALEAYRLRVLEC